jgi:hypothetical protein
LGDDARHREEQDDGDCEPEDAVFWDTGQGPFFRPFGACYLHAATHGLRRGLCSFAASRLLLSAAGLRLALPAPGSGLPPFGTRFWLPASGSRLSLLAFGFRLLALGFCLPKLTARRARTPAATAAGTAALRLFQVCKHFFGVAFGLDLFENVLDFAVWGDDERGPSNTPDFFPVHVLFFHHTEGFGNFLVGIGEEGEGQMLLFFKFLLGFGRIGGDAEQHDAGLLNLRICVAEPARFYGSAGSIGSRVKEQNDGLAAQVFEREVFPVLVLQTEVGSFIIDIHGNYSGKNTVEGHEGIGPA